MDALVGRQSVHDRNIYVYKQKHAPNLGTGSLLDTLNGKPPTSINPGPQRRTVSPILYGVGRQSHSQAFEGNKVEG